jgi:E3 ubiquitin-protein ligase TRIP12
MQGVVEEEEEEEEEEKDHSFDLYNNDDNEVEQEEDEEDEEEMMHYEQTEEEEDEEEEWDNEPKDDEHHSDHEDEEEDHVVDEEHNHEDEDEDEDDDEDDDDELGRVRRTLGLQMQGLFGGIMSGGGSDSSRFRSILSSLKNNDDPTMQLIALQELAEILSVSSEDNLAGYFSSDNFSKELVRIMKGPDELVIGGSDDMDEDMMLALAMSEGFSGGNPEVMLLACRCISNLLEAMPTAVTSVVFHGAIRVLTQKLKSIQYIDLAEQALYVRSF